MTAPDQPAALLTVFIADDHKIVRDGLRLLIERAGGFRVVGDAANGRALVTSALALSPDVVIADMAMPELNGLQAVEQLRIAGYPGAIVMLSSHDERRTVAQAFAAGANGYLHKDEAFEQVLAAIAAVRRGETFLSPRLASLTEGGQVLTLAELLSMREREVLQLLAEGHATKEVAFRLNLSPKTIETHRLSLFAKLKVNNVADLARIAIREGLIQP